MFPNLKAELARRNLTVQDLAELTGIPYSTLSPKLNGQRPLKVVDAEKIRDALNGGFTIDFLFCKPKN